MSEQEYDSDGLYHDDAMAQSQEYDSDETRDDQNEPNVEEVEETQIEFDGRQQQGGATSDKMEIPKATKGKDNADYNFRA
jgi:hypothetical protein